MIAPRRSSLRFAVVTVLALGAAIQVVRSTLQAQWVDDRPELAARVWPGHPRVDLALSMGAIGRAAAVGQPPPPAAIAQAMRAATRAPLAVEPFLIEGALATAAATTARAETLFVEAKRRDPRSPAARFFLAHHYLAAGRAADGLKEAAVLTRLVPQGSAALVPGLVQYARTPGAVPNLKRTLDANPALAEPVLTRLARDADNADLVIALAGDGARGATPAPPWQAALLQALVERGDYARALALWRTIGGVTGNALLFNPQFAKLAAPPPFNWTFASGDFGVAEPVAPASLQIIYYGRANADFVTQTLLLAPGPYTLAMDVVREGGDATPSGLRWTVDCQPGGQRLLELPLAGGASALSGRFTVPPGCAAQRLRLSGVAREFAASEQAVVSRLQLRGGAR